MTTSTALCVVCERPVPDVAYVCLRPCAQKLAEALTAAAGHAEDAETVIARQARYGGAGGGIRKPELEPARTTEANRRNPVTAFGWQASVERPRSGALYPEPMPYDDGAADRLAGIGNTVTGWARHICETRGVELPARRPLLGPLCAGDCGHASCAGIRHRRPPSSLGEAAAWLATQVGWLRARPEAREAFAELHAACDDLRRLVDRPGSDYRLVGMCDCGRILYAAHGRTVVRCPDPCGATWHVERSQQILRRHLDETLMTAAEAARLAVHLDGGDRGVEQVRKLINAWSKRGLVTARGQIREEPDPDDPEAEPKLTPTYRFGDLAERLARTPTRKQREGAAA